MKDCHVHSSGKDTFSATLNQTNIGQNNNKFYIVQVLAHDTRPEYWLWSHWGRGLLLLSLLLQCSQDCLVQSA